ncbi:TPA: transcriptional activator RinB [Staphylococcus aureus]
MIKQILRLLFLLAMYELGKYVTEQVYIMMTANDEVKKRALIGASAKDDVELLNGFEKIRAEVSW